MTLLSSQPATVSVMRNVHGHILSTATSCYLKLFDMQLSNRMEQLEKWASLTACRFQDLYKTFDLVDIST